ncbi:hypothetical protein DRQ05_03730 [bacterium]|nr:MAG: hypothetical protein DRQ05_03730 [bacterium]
MAIWTAIHPGTRSTRVIATMGVRKTLFKAQLRSQPKHIRALPTLLEALALWEGEKVHAALVVDEKAATFDMSIYRDSLEFVDPTPLYQLDVVGHLRHKPSEDASLRGMGDFRDLRQLLLWEVAQ